MRRSDSERLAAQNAIPNSGGGVLPSALVLLGQLEPHAHLERLALLEFDRSNLEKGRDFLRRAAHAPPVRASRALNYARFLAQRGRPEEARVFLTDWIVRHGWDESVAREIEILE